jgi:hypothetical protein
MSSNSQSALDSVDRFISVAAEIAQLPILGFPEYRAAAEDLYQIANKLLDANENMARWLFAFCTLTSRPRMLGCSFSLLCKTTAQRRQGQAFERWSSIVATLG